MGEEGGSGGHGGQGGGGGGGHGGNAAAAAQHGGESGAAPHAAHGGDHGRGGVGGKGGDNNIVTTDLEKPDGEDPMSPRIATPNPFSRKNTSVDLDDYFTGPRDMQKHSKWPLFLQMHGSILPKMIVPLICVGLWAFLITALSEWVDGVNLGVNSILLTITGFVVGLGLSFRSSTAYERYAEGRRYWGQLVLTCQSLGRAFWIHANERPESVQEDILGKLTAMNLLVAFSVSLKHKLRFEPYTYYEDLSTMVDHLDTFARTATNDNVYKSKRPGFFKSTGENLGLSFATSNPRKVIKKAKEPLGNLPLEILCYLSAYTDEIVTNGQLPIGMQQTLAYNSLGALNDVLVNTERVLNTPLPIAYTIAIAQITWVYVLLLPFQLYNALGWITIPATIAAAYIILGILFIGREIENPFGNDVNDLPLDHFCLQIVQDMETISSRPKPRISEYVASSRNLPLYPMSSSSFHSWVRRPESSIRNALRNRPYVTYDNPKTSDGQSV